MEQPTWIGRSLGGRYRIEAMLGQGGMSAVYKATDPNLKRMVAIKLIHPHLSIDPSFVQRFEGEAAAVASLRHPNIVQVFDFNSDNGVYYMVLEFIPGETLQDRMKRLSESKRHLSIEETLTFTQNIAEAVGYAHQRGLVHRDIKPANIMLDVHGQAILMDFGIVKMIGGDSHTSTGAVVGTARYMPPEIIRGEAADHRSDIYSLGVTLYEMLSGRPPFMADSAMTLMMMHLNDPVPDVRGFRPDIPPEIMRIIQRCLAKDRNDRYQSARDLANDLQRALSSVSSPATFVQARQVAPSVDADATWHAAEVKKPAQMQERPVAQIQAHPKSEVVRPSPKKKSNPLIPLLAGGGLVALLICAVLGANLFRTLSQRSSPQQTEEALLSLVGTNTPELASTEPVDTPTQPTTAPTLVSVVEVLHLMTPVSEVQAGTTIFDVESVDTSPEKRAPYGDSYDINLLERPFLQDMTYVPDLDIASFNLRQTEEWYYVSIELVGDDPNNALGIRYGVELDVDRDGFGDFLILASPPYAADWSTKTAQVYADENNDTSGKNPKRSEAPFTADGYETLLFDGGKELGDDPDLAWVRHPGDNTIQFAFRRSWAGESFMYGVLSDGGLKDVTQLDYTDRFTVAEAGSPVRSNPHYPLKSLFAIDTTCRSTFGFSQTGYESRICPVIVLPSAGGGSDGDTNASGCQPPPEGCPMDAPNWWPDPHCACSFTPYNP